MKYSDFLEIIKNDVCDNVLSYYKYVVNYFYNNKDQKKLTVIEEDMIVNSDIKSCFDGFSIGFGYGILNVENYMAFVDPSVEMDVLDQLGEFSEKYLPMGVVPTHVCILTDDTEIINSCYNQIKSKFSSIILVQLTNIYNPNLERKVRMENLIGNKYDIFYLDSYCEKLVLNYDEHNVGFIKLFDKVVTDLIPLVERKCVAFGGDYESIAYRKIFPLLITELYIRNAKCVYYVDDDASLDRAQQMSAALFNPDCMLVEDVVRFLVNLPKVNATLRNKCLIINYIASKELYLSMDFVPLNNLKAKVTRKRVSVRDIKIIPYKTHYNLESNDFIRNYEVEKECRTFLHSLYDVLNVANDTILSVVNTVFFEMDGVEYVGHVLKYDFRAKGISCMSGQKACPVTLNIEDVRNLIYLNLALNLKDIFSFIKLNMKALDVSVQSVIPKKLARPLSNLMMEYPIKNSYCYVQGDKVEYWSDVKNSVFLNGMSSNMSKSTRGISYRYLLEELGVERTRNILDSFGSFNLVTNPKLVISTSRAI